MTNIFVAEAAAINEGINFPILKKIKKLMKIRNCSIKIAGPILSQKRNF